MQTVLSWTSKLLAILFVASVLGSIVTIVTGQTIMNSTYLEGKLRSTNAYSRLAAALAAEVAQQPAVAGNQQAADVISRIVTPAVLEQTINPAIEQLALYYQGKGPAPSIDLSGITSQIQAAGVPLPANTTFVQPTRLVPDSGTNKTIAYPGKSIAGVRVAVLIMSVMLALALVAVSWLRHKWAALPNAVITIGVFTGLLAMICVVGSSLITRLDQLDAPSNAFAGIGPDVATAIAHDLAWRFGLIAVALLAVGIAARVLVAKWPHLQAATPGTSVAPTPLQ